MLNRSITLPAALLCVGMLALAASRSQAQDGKEAMDMMQMPEPTEEHHQLQDAVGTWKGTVTMSMPGMPSEPSEATEVVRSLGGFWVTSDFTSDFMGTPYHGHGSHTYDERKQKYVSTWIDNWGSYLSVMEGEMEGDTLVMHWEAPTMTGEIAPHRSEQVMDGDDAYTMTFFTADQQTMVIEMKRTSKQPVEAGAGR